MEAPLLSRVLEKKHMREYFGILLSYCICAVCKQMPVCDCLFSFLDIHTVYLRKRLFPNLASSSVVQLEMMCVWWERFSSESEMLSLWISEKEKELESITSTSSLDPLDKNISRVEACHVFSSLTTFSSVMYFSSPWHFSYQSRQVSTLT